MNILAKGISACNGVAKGKAKIVLGINDLNKIEKGDILVVLFLNPACTIVMGKVSGIVAEKGNLNCHAAIVSREFGIPCIVAAEDATKNIKDGQTVKLDAEKGEVYGF